MKTLPANGFVRHVLPAILYVVGIFYGGSIQVALPRTDRVIPSDKVLHCLAFGGLAFLMFRAVRYALPDELHVKNVSYAVMGSVAVGGLLEAYQAILPHRSAEVLDLVADALGAMLAGGLLLRRQEKRA